MMAEFATLVDEEVEVTKDYLMNIISFQSYERKEGMKLYKK